MQHLSEFCTNIIRGPPVPEKNGDERSDGFMPAASTLLVSQMAEDFSTNNVELETLNGLSIRFAQGTLGLQKA